MIMSNPIDFNIDYNELVSKFQEEYEKRINKFLLFDFANANENSHTKVLNYLLQYNNSQFLPSFCDRIGLPKPNGKVEIKEQKDSIGTKGKGYIDLYLTYDGLHVIIENKIYGAGDTQRQLARYIAAVNGVSNEDFDHWYKSPSGYLIDYPKTHVVYLSADGTQLPKEHSLPPYLQSIITYYGPSETENVGINYTDHLLPWLEEDVLPNVPYGEDVLIAGLKQYIASLKLLLCDVSSKVLDDFVAQLKEAGKTATEQYNILLKAAKQNHQLEPDIVLTYRKQLKVRAEAIFSADIPDDWVLHFTPTFILFYKKSWASLDKHKGSIPSLYIYAGSSKKFLETGYFDKLTLGVDHLSKDAATNYPYKFGNYGKSIGLELTIDKLRCENRNDKSSRETFYKNIISTLESTSIKVDEVVADLQNSTNAITPDDILVAVLDKKIGTPPSK